MARNGGAAAASPLAAALACSSNAASMEEEEDLHERLLPARNHDESEAKDKSQDTSSVNSDDDDDAFTHEELLHSIGSFSAVVWPVTVTMLFASFVSINVVDPAMAEALADAYLVYGPSSDQGASDGTKFEQAVINAVVIVCFFLVATFVIVACYKFNFNRILVGYMMFSSAMLLGLLGGNIVLITLAQFDIIIDSITFWVGMYNFAVVGVIAVFYQKGTPTWLAQIYLVLTSVIMAWQLGQFPEWSTWALVVVLAFYDLCAVLTPCGPLKWLVNLVQQEGRPLPGLLYEAEVKHPQARYPTPKSDRIARTPHQPTDKYYQCEAEIPLRLESPGQGRICAAAEHREDSPRHDSGHDAIIKKRLAQFYARYNPQAIPKIDRIIERYRGRESELWHDLYQKYARDEGEEPSTIKLGLGDFVFYSVLVSRAAMFDFSAMVGCLIAVLMGLGGTLFLLGIYKKALPALPISILLAVSVYFWMRVAYFPFLESYLDAVNPV